MCHCDNQIKVQSLNSLGDKVGARHSGGLPFLFCSGSVKVKPACFFSLLSPILGLSSNTWQVWVSSWGQRYQLDGKSHHPEPCHLVRTC